MTEENIFRFADKCTYNYIEFEKSENITWITSQYVDPDNCKLFMLLLKSSFENMKSKGCTTYQQLVLQSDWDGFLKENKEWVIVEKYDESLNSADDNDNNNNSNHPATILISCDIDFATELIIDGFLRNNKTF